MMFSCCVMKYHVQNVIKYKCQNESMIVLFTKIMIQFFFLKIFHTHENQTKIKHSMGIKCRYI